MGVLCAALAFEYPILKYGLFIICPKKVTKIITPWGLAKILEVDIFKDSISLELEDGKKVRITEEEYHRYFYKVVKKELLMFRNILGIESE